MALPKIEVVLTATANQLNRVMDQSEARIKKLGATADTTSDRMAAFSSKMIDLGRRGTVMSAGLAAAAGGFVGLARGEAQAAREIVNFSRLANANTTEFQRMAAGAQNYGVNQEKLSGILKDVNDRVGEFVATGGGPMKDFFDDVAPKVGVTADQFKELSGPAALQLYVDTMQKAGLSQQQMTYYMEAMAGDATALIPLLKDSGAELNKFGDAAQEAGAVKSEALINSSEKLTQTLGRISMKLEGVKNAFWEYMMPLANDMAVWAEEKIIPAVMAVVETLGELVTGFQGLPEGVQAAAGIIAVAFGAGGPALMALGGAINIGARLIGYFGRGGLIGVALGLGVIAWQEYGDEVTVALEAINAEASRLYDKLLDVVGLGEKAGQISLGARQGSAFTGPGIPGMIGGVAGAISGALSPAPAGATGSWESGAAVADGMVDGFSNRMMEREEEIRSIAGVPERIFREVNQIQSPSKVFHALGEFLGLGLANGINASTEVVGRAASNMGRVAVAQADASVGAVLTSMGNLFQGSKKIGAAIAIANSWLAFTEVLKDPSFVGRPLARFAAAATALSSGLNAARNINSAQVGSGGGAGAAASGGGSGAGMPIQTYNVTLVGETQRSDTVADLFRMMNDGARAGHRLEINVLRGAL